MDFQKGDRIEAHSRYEPIKTERQRVRKKEVENVRKKEEEKKSTEEDVLNEMHKLAENGIAELTSTLLRDKLGLDKESGRDQIRRLMRKLEKAGKVSIIEKAVEKRKRYVYRLKESE